MDILHIARIMVFKILCISTSFNERKFEAIQYDSMIDDAIDNED